MIVFENLDNILKGKSEGQINKDFKSKYGIDFLSPQEITDKFNELGIDAKAQRSIRSVYYSSNNEEKFDIRIKAWKLFKTTPYGNMKHTIGVFLTKDEAEKAANSLIGFVDPFDSDMYFEIEKDTGFTKSLTHMEALELLSNIIKNNGYNRDKHNIIVEI